MMVGGCRTICSTSLLLISKTLSGLQLTALQTASRKRETELEEEKAQLVKTAKEFAVERELQFTEKIELLEQNVNQKEERLQDVESEVNQLRHSLQSVQREKAALLEASEERDQEFEVERRQWDLGTNWDLKVNISGDYFCQMECLTRVPTPGLMW